MHKITSSIAILALLGASAAATPGMAQSFSSRPTTPGSVDCSLPSNQNIPYCIALSQGHNNNGNKGPQGPQGGPGGPGGPGPGGQGGPGGPGGPNGQGHWSGPPSGSWNWSSRDRDQFHQRFRGFDFGTFGTPNFSIHLGIGIPGSYYHYLRPVPRSIYRYYPWFRGYLYFVGRGGQFVIVSPRTHRIVAII